MGRAGHKSKKQLRAEAEKRKERGASIGESVGSAGESGSGSESETVPAQSPKGKVERQSTADDEDEVTMQPTLEDEAALSENQTRGVTSPGHKVPLQSNDEKWCECIIV